VKALLCRLFGHVPTVWESGLKALIEDALRNGEDVTIHAPLDGIRCKRCGVDL